MTNRSKLKAGLVILALSSTAVGCADHVKSAVVTCPCERGICCASGVCADDESACAAATQALSSASVGHWTGYLENYAFPSGSDAVDLSLHVEADGSLAGEVVLGQGPAPAPPTDGSVAWPPGYPPANNNWYAKPLEGFRHHLINVEWTALRLKFDLNVREAWGSWCRLQTSYNLFRFVVPAGDTDQVPAVWGCSPTGDGRCTENLSADPNAAPVPVDCGWATLCDQFTGVGVCECNAAGCDAKTEPYVSFDIALRDDEGNGSVATFFPLIDLNGRNVRLIRASH
jgi:hypothetical protein